jgi:hypothetical protein
MRGKLSLLKDERITLLVKVQPANQPRLYQLILGKDFHFFKTSLWTEGKTNMRGEFNLMLYRQ